MSDTTNNVWGSQYNAQRDQYINCTFIVSNDAPLSAEEWRQTFAAYITHLRAANGKVKLIGAENSSLPLDGVYVNLRAARRYEDHEQEHRVRAALREYEEKLNKDERLSPGERFRLIDECHFLFRGGLQPEAEQLALDKAVITYPRLVIVGEPGSGKTTLLRYLAYKFASVGEEGEQIPGFGYRRLPIFVRLTELVKQEYDVLAAAVADYQGNKANLSKLLRQYMERGLALFLLDGLDEVSGSDRTAVRDWLNRFADGLSAGTGRPQPTPLDQQPQGNRIIVTSRINSYFVAALDNANAHFVIQPLKTADRRLFLTSWYRAYETSQGRTADEQAAQDWAKPLAEKLDAPNLERLAEVPLLLSFLAYIWHTDDSKLPSSRVQLYARMVKRMMAQRGEQPLDPATEKRIIPGLACLAFCLNANRDSGSLSRAEAMQFFDPDLQAHWDWLVETAGLLALRGSRTRTDDWGDSVDELMYGFPHRTFEEYFAALYLAAKPDAELQPLLRSLLHDPRWDEVILLTLGHIYFTDGGKQRTHAERLLEKLCLDPEREQPEYEDLFHRDLLFAVRAAGDGIVLAKPHFDAMVNGVMDIYFDSDQNTSRYEQLQQQVEARLKNNDAVARSAVAIKRLLHLLRDEDSHVRARAAEVVGQLGVKDETAIAVLIAVLHDKGSDVRASAARAVGQLGVKDGRLAEALLRLLGDLDRTVRLMAVEVLSQLGVKDEWVVKALMRLLGDADSNVRWSAARAVGQIGVKDEAVVATLLGLLDDENSDVRYSAAGALVQLDVKDEALVAALLGLLHDEAWIVRSSAASELGELGVKDEVVIAALLGLAHDENNMVRDSAASALGELGVKDDAVVTVLLELLDDANSDVRYSAAAALVQLEVKDEAVVVVLLGLRHEEDSDLQNSAARAVGELFAVENEALVTTLLGLLRDENSYLRFSAAGALVQLGVKDEAVVTALLGLLRDEDSDVRQNAAKVVGQWGVKDEAVVATLLGLLHDEDSYVRLRAVNAVEELGVRDETVVTALRGLLHDENRYVRLSAASAVEELGVRDEAVVVALGLLRDADSRVRWNAVNVVGQWGVKNEAVVAALLGLLRDAAWNVRASAARAVEKLRLNRTDVKQALYQLAQSDYEEQDPFSPHPYDAAYEALYTIVSSQRSTADEAICKGLAEEPADGRLESRRTRKTARRTRKGVVAASALPPILAHRN